MPASKTSATIELNGKPHDIFKMPLGRFAEFLTAMGDLPTVIFNDTDNPDFVGTLIKTMGTHADAVLKLLAIASGIPVDTLKADAGIDDVVKIVKAVAAVNNIEYLKKELAPLFQRVQNPAPAINPVGKEESKASGLKG
jgi:hypothetical protein